MVARQGSLALPLVLLACLLLVASTTGCDECLEDIVGDLDLEDIGDWLGYGGCGQPTCGGCNPCGCGPCGGVTYYIED